MEMEELSVSLKLLIETKGKRLVFAEAGKDFVDSLFVTMGLPVPLGSIIDLVANHQMKSSPLANLYTSMHNLADSSYLLTNRDTFLKPTLHPATVGKFYTCTHCGYVPYYEKEPFMVCSDCCENTTTITSYASPPTVKAASYLVTDDLVVKPMSAIGILTLLNQFNVKGVGDLEEIVVDYSVDEAARLIKASMTSDKNILTDVFLNGTDAAGS